MINLSLHLLAVRILRRLIAQHINIASRLPPVLLLFFCRWQEPGALIAIRNNDNNCGRIAMLNGDDILLSKKIKFKYLDRAVAPGAL